MDLDIAVVGGGVSGAYSAWRLQQDRGKTQRIGLFEYSDRIGGRLYSVSIPGMPNVKAELGGMRYIPTQHIVVADLIKHLKLKTADFPMGAPSPVGSNCNLFYLRGKHLRLHELSDPEKVPYNMAWSERGLGPTNLQVQVMNNLYPGFANLSLCQQMQVKVFGKPMYEYGFWDLLFRVLSNEGYAFMRDAGGYEANVANACAVTQLPATEYSDTTQFLTLADGYDMLPITLAQQFNDKFDGKIAKGKRLHMNHRLASFEVGSGEYPYALHFMPTVSDKNRRTFDAEDASTRTVRAKQLILALPRRSLELIDSPFFDDPWLKKNIPSVLIQTAFKLLMAYETPWWRSLGLVAGRSVTDLPVRQIYYFGTEGEQPDGEPFLNSLLMASYNDISTVPFWKGLEIGEEYKGYRPACIEEGAVNWIPLTPYCATAEMVDVANRQIATVHALPQVPAPYSAVYHTWNEDPYGGGWHEWKAGYRLDQIMCQMRKPVQGQEVYIVGEAYSLGQGWVEGALDIAESTLQDFFGMKPPRWLDPSYALMPNPCPPGDPCTGCGDLDGCIPCFNCGTMLSSITPNCLCAVEEG
ncbi:FAD-dependent oxidoreductase [Sphingomonas sp. ZT3P38]|uniref:flavin monoamine oxidase family protein n=1 Tax=Parasphingomonas zepuensis TaxID=3096161 RepID=UPI002FC73951